MKIAVFHELDQGGARTAANEFARGLKKLGHEVDLFVVDSSFDRGEQEYYSSIKVYKFVPVKWNGGNWRARLYRDTVELFRLQELHRHIAADIDAKGYDLVLVHPSRYTQAPFLLRYVKTKTVYYCQETLRLVYDSLFAISPQLRIWNRSYESLSRLVRRKIDRTNISYANTILANSRYTQKHILQDYGLKSTVCHLGVDTEVFYPSSQKKFDVLFIGSKSEQEGYTLFQDALHLLKRQPIVRYHLRGEHWVATEQLRDLYSQARVVLCLSSHEPFGLVVLEAMACGAVVIALDEGGYQDSIVNGKTGLFVSRHPEKLEQAIHKVLNSERIQNTLQKNALASIKTYWSWQKATQRLLKALV